MTRARRAHRQPGRAEPFARLSERRLSQQPGLTRTTTSRKSRRMRCPPPLPMLRGADWLGANVTIPYKEAVLPLMDTVSDEARAVGAVNTIINRNGQFYGANSDIPGFAAALREEGVDVTGQTVLLLGAGGSARAVAMAVRQMGAARLVIANRTAARAEAVAALWSDGNATATALDSP